MHCAATDECNSRAAGKSANQREFCDGTHSQAHKTHRNEVGFGNNQNTSMEINLPFMVWIMSLIIKLVWLLPFIFVMPSFLSPLESVYGESIVW